MPTRKPIPVIDIFAGPGGLGEGFCSAGRSEGEEYFKIHLSIEKDRYAHQTLELRSFFRQFPYRNFLPQYYAFLRSEISREDLYRQFSKQAENAQREAWLKELGDQRSNPDEVTERIDAALGGSESWVLIGGPPCQAFSLAGRSRNKGKVGYTLESDKRCRLYLEYLKIIADHWPAVFVMENVTGLLSSTIREERIFERIREDLESPCAALSREGIITASKIRSHRYRICSVVNYDNSDTVKPESMVVKTELHGVPQARHRLILLGLRDDLGNVKPKMLSVTGPVSAISVLKGLPPLRSGLSQAVDTPDEWLSVIRDSLNRRWFRGVYKTAGREVQDCLRKVVMSLRCPDADRGKEFIPCQVDIGYQEERDWFLDGRIGGVCNHITRSHIASDLHRYFYAACFTMVHSRSPNLGDFPPDLLPKHQNRDKALAGRFFADRFRVQAANRPSTTITCHISKDGHYYIHPDPYQCRSLTVREAARLQTFPDNYFFSGVRTSQYVQVGNAVPPLLSRKIAVIVYDALKQAGVEP